MFGIILWLRKFSMFEEDSAFVQNALMKDRIVCLTKFLKYSILFLIKDLILLLIQGGSLLSMVTISFKIVTHDIENNFRKNSSYFINPPATKTSQRRRKTS